MECRAGCGACCIVPAIHTPFFGMPDGKAAGERCAHLTVDWLCGLFNDPRRPACCAQFQAEPEYCGNDLDMALILLTGLERESDPTR
jgi:Fe-S-cluster containining protein